ncbi:hypothetical protein J6590_093824 [Homalodisca vitripennis]|nr:hypothetical protein J6590_093824 [Homalodisca vitripennis]
MLAIIGRISWPLSTCCGLRVRLAGCGGGGVRLPHTSRHDVQNFIKQKKMEKLKQVRRHSSRARPLAGRIALVISLIKILETERKGAIISRDCEEEEENGVRNSLQSGPEARPESLFARVSCSIIVNFQLKGELCPPLKKYKMETSPLAEKSLRRWNSPHTSFLSLFSTLCFKFAPVSINKAG